MENSPKYFDPHLLAKLEGLELRARYIVEGYVAGMHQSPFHGFSIEFAEHREYVPGDDLRYVDWKVFGRTDKIYLKQYEEETNLVVYLVVDSSRSMTYQSDAAALSKLEFAQCTAASLAHLILTQQDSVGLATFNDQVRHVVRPSGAATHRKAIIHALEETQPVDKTRTGPILHELAERFKQRGVVILFSDLFDSVDSLLAGLKHLRYRRHEVIVFHTLDPAELDFPFRDATLFKGLEAEDPLLTDPRALRKAYLEALENFRRAVMTGCRDHQIDYQLVRTDQTIDRVLTAYLSSRMSRK